MDVDRAAEVARYLLEADPLPNDDHDVLRVLCRRWPGLTKGEALRGCEIAEELSDVTVRELEAQTLAEDLRGMGLPMRSLSHTLR